MSTQHAKLPPSGASRWLTCTKSPEAEAGRENKSSVYAEEGTRAHKMLELWRKEGKPEKDTILASEVEMVEAVTRAYDYVESLKMQDPGSVEMNEVAVGPNALGPDVWGTTDILLYQPAFKTLHVIDYKHGKGIAVDLPSQQVEIYAILALETFGFMFGGIESIQTTIIQPRAIHGDGPIRSENYTPEELETISMDLQVVIKNIREERTHYAPSESACRWCLAAGDCPAQDTKCLDVAMMAFGAIPKKEEAIDVDSERLELFFENRKLINTWLKALDARLLDDLMAGKSIGDLKVVAGCLGNRKWKLDDDSVKAILRKECKLKPKEMTTEKLMGVKQIEDLLHGKPPRNKEAKLAKLAELITRAPGKPTVVAGDNDKPSVVPQFEDLTKGA